MRTPLIVVLMAACGGSSPVSLDADIDGYAPPGCMPATPSDDFAGTRPCFPWGAGSGSATIESGAGILNVTLDAYDAGFGGCVVTDVPFTDAGAFVYTLHDQPVQNAHAWFSVGGLIMVETDDGYVSIRSDVDHQIGYTKNDANARWWRIRPDSGTMVAETSADGARWATVTRSPAPPPATVTIQLGAYLYRPALAPQTFSALSVDLQHFNVCP